MRLKHLPLLLIFLALTSCVNLPVAEKPTVAGPVAKECRSIDKNELQSTKLAKLLDELQTDYKTPAIRWERKEKFIGALDEVIRESEFKYLVECRQNWLKVPRNKYSVEFIPTGNKDSMNVESRGKELVMHFQPDLPVQRVIFVYMHELLHICQMPKSLEIYKKSVGNAQFVEEAQRDGLEIEVEAHHLMQVAYSKFIRYSKRLCAAEDPVEKGPAIFEGYDYFDAVYDRGDFTHYVLNWNAERITNPAAIFDMQSPEIHFEEGAFGKGFNQHHLHPKLIEDLRSRGILVNEPK